MKLLREYVTAIDGEIDLVGASPTLACIVEQFYCAYVRLYVHHTAYALMLQISDNSSHVELTCVFTFTCTST